MTGADREARANRSIRGQRTGEQLLVT